MPDYVVYFVVKCTTTVEADNEDDARNQVLDYSPEDVLGCMPEHPVTISDIDGPLQPA